MNERGFFFTVDSFLSLVFVTAVVLLAMFHMSNAQLDSWNSIDLRQASNDLLIVMEKSGALDNAFKESGGGIIASSAVPIIQDMNRTGHAYCFELLILDSGDISSPEFHVMKPGCSKESVEFASIERPLVVIKDDLVDNYIVRMTGWRK